MTSQVVPRCLQPWLLGNVLFFPKILTMSTTYPQLKHSVLLVALGEILSSDKAGKQTTHCCSCSNTLPVRLITPSKNNAPSDGNSGFDPEWSSVRSRGENSAKRDSSDSLSHPRSETHTNWLVGKPGFVRMERKSPPETHLKCLIFLSGFHQISHCPDDWNYKWESDRRRRWCCSPGKAEKEDSF